ncbi:FAD-dependent oxidoreductase [Piscinibacter sp.]|uniref:FAD-dependent oxidoreductase n=1 Tax=Piscinibacter sp. TaxID=1903157 RepID=UPI002C1382BF|nr:FAD-dependent oxidoreductase [Albitalea sp.]HUG25102.1 FAD-dependent oxidoreductase [Albitalea sp.]
MSHTTPSPLPVAVIGAGPVGLAAAAHLVQRGLQVVIFEAGTSVADNLQTYRHVRLFSPWRFDVDRAAVALLAGTGWRMPASGALPTAGELVDDYLVPLAGTPAIAPHLRLKTRVLAVSRAGFDKVKTRGRESAPFVLRVSSPDGIEEVRARAIVDASGTWSQPNPLGGHGLPAIGEMENAARIRYGMPDIVGAERARYAGRTVLVVGAGHSAAGNLIALAALAEQDPATRLVWALRGDAMPRRFGGGAADGLPARGALGERLRRLVDDGRLDVRDGFRIHRIAATAGTLTVIAEDSALQPIDGVDEIIGATGARPDLRLTSELRVRHDPWLESTDLLAPLIDPNEHSCGTVRPHGHRELAHPETGFYAIGAKSYGRAPNFLMATGYEQARSVAAAIVGDMAAADDVQLELPETGVCSTDLHAGNDAAVNTSGGCCGGPALADASACCALDESKKAAGEPGCGCASPAPAAASPCCA